MTGSPLADSVGTALGNYEISKKRQLGPARVVLQGVLNPFHLHESQNLNSLKGVNYIGFRV